MRITSIVVGHGGGAARRERWKLSPEAERSGAPPSDSLEWKRMIDNPQGLRFHL